MPRHRLHKFLLALATLTLMTAAPAWASWHIGTFQIKRDVDPICENCKDGWLDTVKAYINVPDNGKAVSGYIIEIDLSNTKLDMMITRRVTNGACAGNRGVVSHTNPAVTDALAVDLRTVQQWMAVSGAHLVLSGGFFHYDAEKGVRSNPSCGEVIGVSMSNGELDWPPANRPELLKEVIDGNKAWPADALLITADRRARVARMESFDELKDVAFGINGSGFYNETKGEFQATGTKPGDRIARFGIGVLPGRQKLVAVLIEGAPSFHDTYERGVRLGVMRNIMHAFGAVDAINMDGSGSAQITGLNNLLSRPSDPEGARPIANHIGFRLLDQDAVWVDYGTRQVQD